MSCLVDFLAQSWGAPWSRGVPVPRSSQAVRVIRILHRCPVSCARAPTLTFDTYLLSTSSPGSTVRASLASLPHVAFKVPSPTFTSFFCLSSIQQIPAPFVFLPHWIAVFYPLRLDLSPMTLELLQSLGLFAQASPTCPADCGFRAFVTGF